MLEPSMTSAIVVADNEALINFLIKYSTEKITAESNIQLAVANTIENLLASGKDEGFILYELGFMDVYSKPEKTGDQNGW